MPLSLTLTLSLPLSLTLTLSLTLALRLLTLGGAASLDQALLTLTRLGGGLLGSLGAGDLLPGAAESLSSLAKRLLGGRGISAAHGLGPLIKLQGQ